MKRTPEQRELGTEKTLQAATAAAAAAAAAARAHRGPQHMRVPTFSREEKKR